MTAPADRAIAETRRMLAQRLLDRRASPAHWEGRLASSALSTATAVLALHLAATGRSGAAEAGRARADAAGRAEALPHRSGEALPHRPGSAPSPVEQGCSPATRDPISLGAAWLVAHQNPDGGWGDTTRSRSNISTTAIVWATLSAVAGGTDFAGPTLAAADAWLERVAGATTPDAIRRAILRRYGKDRTFSVPILTLLALCGRLGADRTQAWRSIPQLPFELAALPHHWFQHLRLPVVSYALPALIAIGQVRHHFAPTRNPVTHLLRDRVRARTHALLRAMQPASGGYLEATPLTSFVVMSLAGMGRVDSPVVEHGIRFLAGSMREDGSWPIDTHLATWGTTLAIGALSAAGALPAEDVTRMRAWLLDQQSTTEHPFTHAAPGAWAWTPLSGGVPDADDTSGALLALARLGAPDRRTTAAAAAGARWLLGLQNGDGGMPTFCRGWGTLPFDRSTPEITAHALLAWSAWVTSIDAALRGRLRTAAGRAVAYLLRAQRPDGSWLPLWFGNEHAPGEGNPVYGTARVLQGLCSELARDVAGACEARRRALLFLLAAQQPDGGWGGAPGVPATIEETGVALAALRAVARLDSHAPVRGLPPGIDRGLDWLASAVQCDLLPAAPVGLYFANLWYFEDLYPYVFALAGLSGDEAASSG